MVVVVVASAAALCNLTLLTFVLPGGQHTLYYRLSVPRCSFAPLSPQTWGDGGITAPYHAGRIGIHPPVVLASIPPSTIHQPPSYGCALTRSLAHLRLICHCISQTEVPLTRPRTAGALDLINCYQDPPPTVTGVEGLSTLAAARRLTSCPTYLPYLPRPYTHRRPSSSAHRIMHSTDDAAVHVPISRFPSHPLPLFVSISCPTRRAGCAVQPVASAAHPTPRAAALVHSFPHPFGLRSVLNPSSLHFHLLQAGHSMYSQSSCFPKRHLLTLSLAPPPSRLARP